MKGRYERLYAYDFKMFHPYIIGHNSKFMIPYDEGTLNNYDGNTKYIYGTDILLKGTDEFGKWLEIVETIKDDPKTKRLVR